MNSKNNAKTLLKKIWKQGFRLPWGSFQKEKGNVIVTSGVVFGWFSLYFKFPFLFGFCLSSFFFSSFLHLYPLFLLSLDPFCFQLKTIFFYLFIYWISGFFLFLFFFHLAYLLSQFTLTFFFHLKPYISSLPPSLPLYIS